MRYDRKLGGKTEAVLKDNLLRIDEERKVEKEMLFCRSSERSDFFQNQNI